MDLVGLDRHVVAAVVGGQVVLLYAQRAVPDCLARG